MTAPMILAGIVEYALSQGTSGWLPVTTGVVTAIILYTVSTVLTSHQKKRRSTDDYVNSEANEEPGPKAQLTPVPLPVQPISPPLVNQQRIFSRRTPEELVGLCEGQTEWEATERAKPHIGKWLQIEGPVGDISAPRSSGHIAVTIRLSDDYSRPSLFLWFDEKRWHDHLRALSVGDLITAVGKIDNITSTSVTLEDCELVDS